MPQVFWNAGCQLVALNFQTIGNSGLFLKSFSVYQHHFIHFPGGGQGCNRLRRSSHTAFPQTQVPASPRGSLNVPKPIVKYNLSTNAALAGSNLGYPYCCPDLIRLSVSHCLFSSLVIKVPWYFNLSTWSKSSYLIWQEHPTFFLRESHALRIGGADYHPSHFTLSSIQVGVGGLLLMGSRHQHHL